MKFRGNLPSHDTLFAIGHQGIFRLSGWSRQIHTGFQGSRATWDTSPEFTPFRLRGSHPLCRAFQCPSTMTRIFDSVPACQCRLRNPTTPITQRLTTITRNRFGLFPFRSPLLRESRLISFPLVTEMFHFTRYRFHNLCIQLWIMVYYYHWVSPFGNPRFKAIFRLPEAYRR